MKRWILSALAILMILAMAVPVTALADEDTIVEGVDYNLVPNYSVYSIKDGLKLYNKQTNKSHSIKTLAYGEEMVVEAVSADGAWLGITYQKKGKTRFAWGQKEFLSETRPEGGSVTPAPTPKPEESAKKEKKKVEDKTAEQKAAEKAREAEEAKKQIDSVLGSMAIVSPYPAVITTKSADGTVALRWQPTTEGKLIDYLPNGRSLTVLAEGDGWFQVTDEDSGTTGFMSSRYITRVSAQSAPVQNVTVAPLPSADNVSSLPDGEWHVGFNRGDILSGASGIFMNGVHVYAIDLYDAVQITALAAGDTLVVEGAPHIVNSVMRYGDNVLVNGGLDAGGWTLAPVNGGTYRVFDNNDLATYTDIGVTTLVLSPEAVYMDASDLNVLPMYVQYAGIVDAILSSPMDSFDCYNTTVRIEGGKVMEIKRIYTP